MFKTCQKENQLERKIVISPQKSMFSFIFHHFIHFTFKQGSVIYAVLFCNVLTRGAPAVIYLNGKFCFLHNGRRTK